MVRIIASRDVRIEDDGSPEVHAIIERKGTIGWVARLLDCDPKAPGGFVREFIRPSQGRAVYRLDGEAVYEIDFVYRSHRPGRAYVLVGPSGVEILGVRDCTRPRIKALFDKIEAAIASLPELG